MKKLMNAVLVSVLVITMAGCQTKDTGHKVQDGVFTGTADGYGGKISVDVEFENDQIASVSVTGENESKVIADDALKSVPSHIQSAQSVNVDVSTGATVTSKAVMSAVSQAIVSAGGDVGQWNKDMTGQHKTTEKKLSATVAVIGGGVSGIAVALRLEQLGINTVIIEKSSELGGSFKLSDNQTQLAVSTSDLSNQDDPVESPADLYKDVYAYGAEKGSQDLLHLLFANLTKTTEWETDDLGLSFQNKTAVDGYGGNALTPYNNDDSSTGELLAREADICGADILMNTAMISLVKDANGTITGVTAKASNGTYYTISADYVVLACGSSSNGTTDLPYYGNPENTGDLVTIAAEDDSLQSVEGENVVYHTGIDFGNEQAVDAVDAMHAALKEGLLLVNQKGQRFIDEGSNVYAISNAVSSQTSGASYLIMSVGAYRTFRREVLRNAILSDDMKESLENEDSDFNEKIHFKDIRGISEEYNIDQTSLLNTILEFNDDTDNSSDSLFARTGFGSRIDVGDELVAIPLCTYKTGDLGGIQTDNTLHVVNDNGESIDNVFCIGSAVGGVFGSAEAPGAMNTWAFVSGKTVADIIADAEAAQ